MLEVMAPRRRLPSRADTMETAKGQGNRNGLFELRRSQQKLVESSKFAALGQMAATVAMKSAPRCDWWIANMFCSAPLMIPISIISISSGMALRPEDVLTRLLFYAVPRHHRKNRMI